MRRYRAYDKKFKTLIYSFPEGYSLDLEGNVIKEDWGIVNDDWIIDEHTGLDNIWENDICVAEFYNHSSKNYKTKGVIKKEKGCLVFVGLDHKEDFEIGVFRTYCPLYEFFNPTPNKIYRIGSIHENPEIMQNEA